jgi:carboxyl-terminal processing protease
MSKSKPPRALALLALLVCGVAAARGAQDPPPRPVVPTPAPELKAPADEHARRLETFEIVWRTVKEQHFDPTFGGLDWDAVRAEFAPRVERARTDRELHVLLQQMINRIGQSHFVIIPPESIPEVPADGDDADEEGDEGDVAAADKPPRKGLAVTEQLTHGVGLDFRLIDDAAVVTRVEPASPAERAGLRTGFVLRAIDGVPVRRLLAEFRRESVYQPVISHQLPAEIITTYLNGMAGTTVRVTFLDARERPRTVTLTRERLKGEMSPAFLSLPSQFVEFESRTLRRGIGYVRFNLFVPPVLEKFCAAMRSMRDAPGVVIDLRGNRGGVLGLLYGMGGLLVSSPTSLGTLRARTGAMELRAYPQARPYEGQVVIIVDGETLSAAEVFAAGLQDAGRAVVVGQLSAGETLPSLAKELPTGAILQYAFADFKTPYGRRLEGAGVVPNVEVYLDRGSLLRGRDPQLEAAIETVFVRAPGEEWAVRPGAKADDEDAPPPPPKPAAAEKREETAAAPDAQVEEILDRYAKAVGGREAWARVSSRVSRGKFEGEFAGGKVVGEVEILEKAPNKWVAFITVPGVGVMRRGYTGDYGYEQVPMFGSRRLEGDELEEERLAADFYGPVDLKRLYTKMAYAGKDKVGGADAFVVYAVPARGPLTRLYFDTHTGLLLRRNDTYFEDYREVDGLLLPFTVRAGPGTFRLTEVRHNVAFDDTRLLEQKDCLTQ